MECLPLPKLPDGFVVSLRSSTTDGVVQFCELGLCLWVQEPNAQITFRFPLLGPKGRLPLELSLCSKKSISCLPEGAINGAALRGVDSPVASDLLVVGTQTARRYVPDTIFRAYWSSVTCWGRILMRW